MGITEILKNARPLEKVKASSVLWMIRPNFSREGIRSNYFEKVNNILTDFKLAVYKEPVLKELRRFQGTQRDWNNQKDKVVQKYVRELVDNYVIKEMEKVEYFSQIKPALLVEWAEILASLLVGNELKTNQIRKFLDGVRKVEINVKKKKPQEFHSGEIIFLKVHLAYAQARQKTEWKDPVRPLLLVMETAIAKIREEGEGGFRDFEQYVKFTEAVVAYHKFYGGNDK
jgi:CRISPR-associated protein Csm2